MIFSIEPETSRFVAHLEDDGNQILSDVHFLPFPRSGHKTAQRAHLSGLARLVWAITARHI
jgi:hypothetical protein